MQRRILYFNSPVHLSIKDKQLLVDYKETGERKQASVEDIAITIFDNWAITFTQRVIQELTACNVAVVFCDLKHMPAASLMSLDGGQIQSQVFNRQIEATKPLQKQLWQQTVKAKITNQALLFETLGKNAAPLHRFTKEVQTGDHTNMEARAARYYWQHLFDLPHFRRERFGDPPNNLLNYGYTCLRAAIARSLVSSSLTPLLGFHHHNKYNAYCLADDVMEPYRPFIDWAVWLAIEEFDDYSELTRNIKHRLLSALAYDVHMERKTYTMPVAISRTTASLARCYMGQQKRILYPSLQITRNQ